MQEQHACGSAGGGDCGGSDWPQHGIMNDKQVQDDGEVSIDTSKMSEGKRAALEMSEAAREKFVQESFVSDLFLGKTNWSLVYPFPAQPEEDREKGQPFIDKLVAVLREHVDPDEIDRSGEVPREVFDKLAEIGAFGIKIKPEYDGLGLSQTNYLRSAIRFGSHCGSITTLLSAHQSIGVPQPLILAGTEEQKRKYLPRVATGEVSAFALTEESVGSDPAKMTTTATPSDDGEHYLINGKKLWCTNGTVAGLLVVMAKTPPKEIKGKMRDQITAFVVEADAPGVKVEHRCRFMGLRGIYNGVISFTDVKVPKENVIGAEGRGLKIALSTLNTGRLTIAGGCAGLGKRCVQIVQKWANERVQWGCPIGEHGAIADKIAQITAKTFAMEAVSLLTSRLVDLGKADIRLESAMCKMWNTETLWWILDQTMQIRSGRGYESESSLRERGDDGIGVERMFRDCRVNLIFEGSSEIMRLIIARDALDPHLKAAGAMIDSRADFMTRLKAACKAGCFYAAWYPGKWLPFDGSAGSGLDRRLARNTRRIGAYSRKLARELFHNMARYGSKFDTEQVQLARLVDIGTELFAMAVTCSYAQHVADTQPERHNAIDLADLFCREGFAKIDRLFLGARDNSDGDMRDFAKRVLGGDYDWLQQGIT